MKVTRLAVMVTVLMLIVSAPVGAVYVKEECLNNTHLQISWDFDLTVAGSTTNYTYTQTHNCTYGCNNDRCEGTASDADLSMAWFVFAVGGVLLVLGTVLGLPFGRFAEKKTDRPFDTTMVIKYIFFFVGLFLMYSSLSMIRRAGILYGAESDVVDAVDVATMVIMITIILFLFIFVIEFIFGFLKQMMDSAKEKKWGWREGEGGAE